MPGQIDILLPGLFHLPRHELDAGRALPALNRILRLASPRPNGAFSIDAALRRVLGLDDETRAGLPLAQAWTGDDTTAARLQLVQPVHLRADLHRALLEPIPESDENLSDTLNIINDLSDLFKVDFDISAIAGGLHLMRLHALDAPTCYPHLLSALGKAANPFMEQSRENLPWYRLINEMQMFLHQHPINARRVERGSLPINSLWCWGGGDRPPRLRRRPAWFCDDVPLNRFAASLGLAPGSLDELRDAEPAEDIVVVELRLLEMLKSGAADSLDAALEDIEQRVLQPALRAAGAGRRTLWLRAAWQQDYRLAPAASLKFWRRPRSLADWPPMVEDV
jgi:hypothetical protein